jgi:hypothetical protein
MNRLQEISHFPTPHPSTNGLSYPSSNSRAGPGSGSGVSARSGTGTITNSASRVVSRAVPPAGAKRNERSAPGEIGVPHSLSLGHELDCEWERCLNLGRTCPQQVLTRCFVPGSMEGVWEGLFTVGTSLLFLVFAYFLIYILFIFCFFAVHGVPHIPITAVR